MSSYEFPNHYHHTDPQVAAKQIAAAWIEAVLRGNARDLYMTPEWTEAHRKAVTEELRKLQASLFEETKAGTLNPDPFAAPEEQFV
jgi:hypothetical protein